MPARIVTLLVVGLPLTTTVVVPYRASAEFVHAPAAETVALTTPAAGAGAGDCALDPVTGTCIRADVGTPGSPSHNDNGGPGGGSSSPERTCHWEPAEDHGIGTRESNSQPGNSRGPGKRLMVEVCSDGTLGGTRWLSPGQANNSQPPPPEPEDVLPALTDQVEEMLPVPNLHTPADWFPDGISYVQIPTVFWLDDGTWEAVTATASVPPNGPPVLSVTVTAAPLRLIIDPGDNTQLVVCQGDPPEVPFGGDPEQYTGCSHTYRHSSSTAPNGETWPVTGQIVWHVSWTATNGQSGHLGEVTTTAEPMALPVGEVEGIITG